MARTKTGPRRHFVEIAWTGIAIGLASAAISGHGASDGSSLVRWTAKTETAAANRYEYSLNVRVRPMLFWITRAGVGSARIVRADAGAARVFELLIGSEPDRAPMHINRWGYIAETHRATTTDVIGVMTESDEQTPEEASAVMGGGATGKHRFKAIRSKVSNGETSAEVLRVALGDDLTLRDLDALLERLPEGGPATARLAVPADVRPGFLGAVADLVGMAVNDAAALHPASPPSAARPPRTTSYVWDRYLYDLSCSPSAVGDRRLEGGVCRGCIESEFRARNRTTGKITTFKLTYPVRGSMAGVPVRIVYRPRWWFEAELTMRGAR